VRRERSYRALVERKGCNPARACLQARRFGDLSPKCRGSYERSCGALEGMERSGDTLARKGGDVGRSDEERERRRQLARAHIEGERRTLADFFLFSRVPTIDLRLVIYARVILTSDVT
jgi:hypothetical protein